MKKSTFENMAEKAFLGLEAKFGFKKIETKFEHRTVLVRFQNETTAVLLNYEIGNTPWLEIADLHDPQKKTTLGWLLVEQGLEKTPTPEQAFKPTPLAESELSGVLQKMTGQVLETGADLLKGDFSRLPALQTRARKYDQECKRYLSIHKPKA